MKVKSAVLAIQYEPQLHVGAKQHSTLDDTIHLCQTFLPHFRDLPRLRGAMDFGVRAVMMMMMMMMMKLPPQL